jgi:hypothetical protein
MARRQLALFCVVLFLALGISLFPVSASAGVRLGGISVGGGYYHGFFYPPYYGWGPYPINWAPYWPAAPWSYPGYALAAEAGKVLLQHTSPDAVVYIDGGYAGPASQLKSLRLQPGVYNLELRTDAKTSQWRIYVLSGKTLKIDTRRQP